MKMNASAILYQKLYVLLTRIEGNIFILSQVERALHDFPVHTTDRLNNEN